MEGTPILDGLMEVFPQVNLSTLIEVSIQFKDDIDAAADHVIQNVLPNMVLHPSHPNTNEDLFDRGLQQASDDTSNHLRLVPVDNSSNSNMVQSYLTNEIAVKQLKQSSTDLSSDVSTSGEDHTSEGFSSDSLLADSQLQHNACETNTEISASEDDMSLHDNGSPDLIMRSSYSVNLVESLDDVIADQQHKMMNHTLQRRLAGYEEERAAAQKAKLEREVSALKILREQQLSLEAANKNFRCLEQQAQENAKLKKLLVDRGHAIDALHGEMLGIFDSITELKLKLDMKFPADEPLEQVSSSLPNSAVCPFSAVDEPLQQDSSSLVSSSVVDVPLQQVSSDTLVKSASSKSGSIESLASKSSWSSFAESSSKGDEKIADICDDKFALDDSWDVVDDGHEVASPASPLYTVRILR